MINWKKYHKQIPSSVKIGKNTYEVLWINDFPKDHKQLGESRFNESKQIIINFNQPIKEAVHTYFHEVIHAISEEYNINLTENQVLKFEKSLKTFLTPGNIFIEGFINGSSNPRKRRYRKRSR